MQLSIPLCDIIADNGESSDIANYARDGFLLMKSAAPADLVQRLAAWTRTTFFGPDGKVTAGRLQDAYKQNVDVSQLATLPAILDKLQTLYGRRPLPFQTLNFPVGTQQRTHSDCIHFHSFPQRFMCGVWVALEEVNDQNGGLHYYPGSHRLPVLECHDVGISGLEGGGRYRLYEDAIAELISLAGLQKQIVCMQPGDALIWAANLLHGGEPLKRQGATRFSQVTHYYFEGCRFYTPLHSDIAAGEIALKEGIANIANGRKIEQPPLYKGFSNFKRIGRWLDRRVSLAAKRLRRRRSADK